ncbi:arsenic transporter [Mucilaginibacter pallidiroseus]|uniref:Arsenic transporter n=1 Tax=Mucilaginibacter pallidiroseus TaxID=2599295 RepID=A0A563UHS9_9SPHI|nr:arsenic transporter [Mucilaginibacter pallidiroseus]TWR30942.1 arsenic transporter [Mucilaginibacter pallidiroseus]
MQPVFIWVISILAIGGVITRPFKLPEAVWAVSGAVALVAFGLISPSAGLAGIKKGLDVYLFLIGMMLLAETAREEKLFDWLAAHATRMARGSAALLFFLIYLVGIVVTAFLSNDATAVVLTPAVAAAVKTANAKKPLPFLFICAFIANAASFLLPISNPANLVIYGSHMPSLLQWLPQYLLPSACSIVATYLILRFTQREELKQTIATDIEIPTLSTGGKTALIGIVCTAVLLLISSAYAVDLGLPTAIAGILTCLVVLISAKKSPLIIIKGISWAVLPLVAGLFVIVEALNKTGLTQQLSALLQQAVAESTYGAVWLSGTVVAAACNLMNNLPAGLIVGNVMQTGHVPEVVKSAVLIGIDLGPNLSITGSLATLLWLVALRREGIEVGAWQFLKLGAVVMTAALIITLASLWI